MADQSTSEPVVPPAPGTEGGEREDQIDLTGENILSLLQQAAGLAEENSLYAVEIAQRLSHHLGVAENRVSDLEKRIAELESEVQLYRERSERAEQWLGKISSEIQEQVIRSHN